MKKYKYIIQFLIIVIILCLAYYALREIPIRDDHILINDLSQTKKILITLPKYDSIYFKIKSKDNKQKIVFKKLELVIRNPNNRIVFFTSKYGIRGSNIEPIKFEPCFFSDQNAYPPLWFSNALTVFLSPQNQLELEINYQEEDDHNVFQGASLLMVASCKAKNSSSLKNFSIRPATAPPTGDANDGGEEREMTK